MKKSIIFVFAVLCLNLSYSQPICRGKNVFAFQACETQCQSFSDQESERCASLQQFGCELKSCGRRAIQCLLTADTPCPNSEIPVTSVNITQTKAVEFNLAVLIRGFPLEVVFLIDGSPSMREPLRNIRNELNEVFGQIINDLPSNGARPRIAIAAYGGEGSFDSTGYKAVQKSTGSLDEAVSALDRIPTSVDGPRSTIAALFSISDFSAREILGLEASRQVFVVIGDKTGRETDCVSRFSRDNTGRAVVDRSGPLIMVSVGNPGLNAAIDPVPPCPGETNSPPISSGQGTALATSGRGTFLNGFNANQVWDAIDRARRSPPSGNSNVPTSEISVNTANARRSCQFCPLPPQRGCLDRVRVSTTRELGRFTGPTKFDTKVTLELAPGVCDSGSFSCEVQVLETRFFGRGRFTPVRDIIKVNACAMN